jgi:type I restriction enzyme R subunit
MASRKGSDNLSFYAFTATPKIKHYNCLDVCRILNYRHPKPISLKPIMSIPCAKRLKKALFWMLKNYTNYKVIYKLKQKIEEKDDQVDAKKAKIKLNQWVRLHDHNISQKVRVIIEHFKRM